MRKRLIRGAKLLLLLLPALFLWLFVSRTTPDALRQGLAQQTGARVELVSAERLWFGPGVRLRGLSLDSHAWALKADQVEVRLAYLPLLFGDARPRSIVVSDARLKLAGDGGAANALGRLPLDSSWSVARLTLLGQAGGETREVFYVHEAGLTWLSSKAARAAVAAGPDSRHPANMKVDGEVSSLTAAAFPEGQLRVEVAGFPAQPLLEFLTGERLALRTARLEGTAVVSSAPQQATATGRVRAATPENQLLEAEFSLAATPERLKVESAHGVLAGNKFEASGGVEHWLTAERQANITLRLPRGELRSDTLPLLHEALGREALGFAENLRGGFSAELRFRPAAGQAPVGGDILLDGMEYSPKGLPPLENLRGRLHLEGTHIVIEGVSGRLLDTPARLSGEVRGTQVALRLTTEGIPLRNLPWLAEAELPFRNLEGEAEVEASIGGEALAPRLAGVAHLAGAGFDFREVEVRDLEGGVEFDSAGARTSSLRGQAGACDFELAGAARFADWRNSRSATFRVPACDAGELVRLAEHAGTLKAGLVEPEELTGQGSVWVELDGEEWRGELTGSDFRWRPTWLPRPLEKGSLRARFSPAGVELREARAQLGSSSVSATGRFPLGEAVGGPWRVEVEGWLSEVEVTGLLPESWREWVVLPGPLEGHGVVSGGEKPGVEIEARLLASQPSVEVAGTPVSVPLARSHQLEIRGTVADNQFSMEEFSARVGGAQVHAEGRMPLRREGEFDLRVTAPPATPLPDLLQLVKVPQILGPVEGALAADLRLRGSWDAPAWSGDVELESLRLPKLLTDPVELRGRVEVTAEGFELQKVAVIQPLGTFNISGRLPREGLSELEFAGDWANLDRLLGQLPEGRWTHPAGEFWVRHPARVQVALEEVQFLGGVFSDVRGELRQEEGRFQLFLPEFAFGKGQGELFAETYPERDELLVRVEMDEVSTEEFLVKFFEMEPAVSGALRLDAELTGPLGGKEEFVHGARGRIDFKIPQGRLQRGTLPERLFAVAVLLNEGLYGFGLNRLARLFKPTGLRRFRDWSGRVELEEGKALIVESTLYARVYDVTLTGEVDVPSGAFQVHGEGNFHPGWEFDISLQAIVNLFARMFQLARGKRTTPFEFDVAGDVRGSKRVQNFRFK